ncbi:MAG: hypothetical protein M1817_004091 [Caeruleum heppii]|nr:MAG: hypothetical protein M1817_004091 [Caeruleum heppii]
MAHLSHLCTTSLLTTTPRTAETSPRSQPSSYPPLNKDILSSRSSTPSPTRVKQPESKQPEPKKADGDAPNSPPPAHHLLYRPHLLRPSSSPNGSTTASSNGSTQKSSPPASAPQSPTASGRKNSWLSGITSRFSSPQNAQSASEATPTKSKPAPEKEKPAQMPPQRRASLTEAAPVPEEDSVPYTPAAPKPSNPSFLQSALRKLSSNSTPLAGMGRLTNTGGLCERRVMNVDRQRSRCRVQELDQSKLRRVAFCVDVEIAGGPKYKDDEGAPNGTTKKHKDKVKKLKEKGEGEALKNPDEVKEAKETDGVIKVQGQPVETDTVPGPDGSDEEVKPDTSKKKEKKKKSEEERKDRKERKRKQAEANGKVPVETTITLEHETAASTPSEATTPNVQDRPTTDPLRIYRRCCQLRETPILKKVTEQLLPANCRMSAPGVIACLDLSGYWMQLPDLVTLSDWLAVVPVKRLMMENCGLGDEAVRVLLAGLLAAKAPGTKKTKSTVNGGDGAYSLESRSPGFVEKLSFKGNPKIGRDGWRYLSLFIHMSRSIKAIDLSSVPFPRSLAKDEAGLQRTPSGKTYVDTAELLSKAMAERLGGAHLEELVISECDPSTEQVGMLVDGLSKAGLRRFGFASNHLTAEGLRHVARFLEGGSCEGLDLGGNDLRDLVYIVAGALGEKNPLYALSLADCNLCPESLSTLLPALEGLPNFRFIDLSHNRNLFSTQPNALGLLRKYLPRLHILKRIHLVDVALTADHAIALAEVLPESPSLAHLSILENPAISALASATDPASQEEACALYASLMAAVRVSDTIICIDIDVPGSDSSEIVKALAKQVVAYCLRNMERGPVAEYDSAAATITDPHGGEKQFTVPDVLLQLVGHVEGYPEDHDADEPAPDDDYLLGGTGVVKALGICLGSNTSRRQSGDQWAGSGHLGGTSTPSRASIAFKDGALGKGKAKEMSKNLLESARKIRARLQPALARGMGEDDMSYRRLLFLDRTLDRMILRFEDEYPETRITPSHPPPPPPTDAPPSPPLDLTSPSDTNTLAPIHTPGPASDLVPAEPSSTSPPSSPSSSSPRPSVSRASSTTSLSQKLSSEEALMHRFGQQMRRDLLRPQMEDHAHGTTGQEPPEEHHLQMIRERLEGLSGEEVRVVMEKGGVEGVLRRVGVVGGAEVSGKDHGEWTGAGGNGQVVGGEEAVVG